MAYQAILHDATSVIIACVTKFCFGFAGGMLYSCTKRAAAVCGRAAVNTK